MLFTNKQYTATKPRTKIHTSILIATKYPYIALFLGCLNVCKSPVSKTIIVIIFTITASAVIICIQPLFLLQCKQACLKIP